MPQGFNQADLDSFFDIDPGHGELARIFKPDANGDVEMDQGSPPAPVFLIEVNAIFRADLQEISLYPETTAQASDPWMVIKAADAVGVKRGYRVVFPDAQPPAECASKTFECSPRNTGEDVQTVRLHLKEL